MIRPEPFSSLRFSQYARDLSKAVQELSRENKMRAFMDANIPPVGAVDRDGIVPEGQTLVRTSLPPVNFLSVSQMSITGLQSGAFQAKLAEMRQRIADSQAKGLAKIDEVVTQGAAELEAAAENAAAKAKSEVADALQEFGLTTNGGPV